ncbi:MAG: class I SAM-dependent methyltransferase [Clostridia bacterium]|nr:class I SAM-dependent methyltransferase [Clostridia bacterium]
MKTFSNGALKYWNTLAANYDKQKSRSQKAYVSILELMAEEVSGDMRILDIGTGTGDIALGLSKHVKSIDAIDYSPEMIKLAKEKAREKEVMNISFQTGDCYQLPFEDETFDRVIMSNLIHIIEHPDQAIEEAKRVLKESGLLILPTYLHKQNVKSVLVSRILQLKGHPVVTRFNETELLKYIGDRGLRVQKGVLIKNMMPLLFVTAMK